MIELRGEIVILEKLHEGEILVLNLKFTSEFLAPNASYLTAETIPIYRFLPSTEF